MHDAFTALAIMAQAAAQIEAGAATRSAAKGQARIARARAVEVAEDERRKGRRLSGKQRAAFAKSGVLIGEGTPIDVMAQTAADAETNALRAAIVFEQQASDFESAGSAAFTQGILGAGVTILGGVQSFADLVGETPGRGTKIPARAGSVSAPSGSFKSFGSPEA